jgi:beta-phosphoglucomutase
VVPSSTMRPLGAVIFDMDGVIVDSEPIHEEAFLEVVEQLGYTDRHGVRFADYLGRSDVELWVDFIERNQPRQSLEVLLALKRQRVIQIIQERRPIFPGLPELVQRLAANCPLGVASGSERAVIEAVLEIEGLGGSFSAVVSAGEVPRGKPAPDIFLRAAALLKASSSACWVIEDSKPGIAAALAAGMRVIAIPNTHPAGELDHATHVVHTYEEIGRLLLNSA